MIRIISKIYTGDEDDFAVLVRDAGGAPLGLTTDLNEKEFMSDEDTCEYYTLPGKALFDNIILGLMLDSGYTYGEYLDVDGIKHYSAGFIRDLGYLNEGDEIFSKAIYNIIDPTISQDEFESMKEQTCSDLVDINDFKIKFGVTLKVDNKFDLATSLVGFKSIVKELNSHIYKGNRSEVKLVPANNFIKNDLLYSPEDYLKNTDGCREFIVSLMRLSTFDSYEELEEFAKANNAFNHDRKRVDYRELISNVLLSKGIPGVKSSNFTIEELNNVSNIVDGKAIMNSAKPYYKSNKVVKYLQKDGIPLYSYECKRHYDGLVYEELVSAKSSEFITNSGTREHSVGEGTDLYSHNVGTCVTFFRVTVVDDLGVTMNMYVSPIETMIFINSHCLYVGSTFGIKGIDGVEDKLYYDYICDGYDAKLEAVDNAVLRKYIGNLILDRTVETECKNSMELLVKSGVTQEGAIALMLRDIKEKRSSNITDGASEADNFCNDTYFAFENLVKGYSSKILAKYLPEQTDLDNLTIEELTERLVSVREQLIAEDKYLVMNEYNKLIITEEMQRNEIGNIEFALDCIAGTIDTGELNIGKVTDRAVANSTIVSCVREAFYYYRLNNLIDTPDQSKAKYFMENIFPSLCDVDKLIPTREFAKLGEEKDLVRNVNRHIQESTSLLNIVAIYKELSNSTEDVDHIAFMAQVFDKGKGSEGLKLYNSIQEQIAEHIDNTPNCIKIKGQSHFLTANFLMSSSHSDYRIREVNGDSYEISKDIVIDGIKAEIKFNLLKAYYERVKAGTYLKVKIETLAEFCKNQVITEYPRRLDLFVMNAYVTPWRVIPKVGNLPILNLFTNWYTDDKFKLIDEGYLNLVVSKGLRGRPLSSFDLASEYVVPKSNTFAIPTDDLPLKVKQEVLSAGISRTQVENLDSYIERFFCETELAKERGEYVVRIPSASDVAFNPYLPVEERDSRLEVVTEKITDDNAKEQFKFKTNCLIKQANTTNILGFNDKYFINKGNLKVSLYKGSEINIKDVERVIEDVFNPTGLTVPGTSVLLTNNGFTTIDLKGNKKEFNIIESYDNGTIEEDLDIICSSGIAIQTEYGSVIVKLNKYYMLIRII